jgi:hypothetical protein
LKKQKTGTPRKTLSWMTGFLFVLILISCSPEIKTDYQEFYDKSYGKVLFIINGNAETLSAYSPDDMKVYRDLQTVGHNGSSEAWPSDLLSIGNDLFTVCSGQNVIEKYDSRTLDYLGNLYLKNGFNPLLLAPLGSGDHAAVTGFATDEIVIVNLNELSMTSGFLKVYSESSGTITDTNATGDNYQRSPTGIAATDNTLYVSNVRYDASILLTDVNGETIPFGDAFARAAGNFREGTLSVFTLNSGKTSASLVREINLDKLLGDLPGESPYYPGNGLNPQSLFLLEGKLHIVCTGTNGGEARKYTSSEYIPPGSTTNTIVPGTDPDDGVILVMNLNDSENPTLEKVVSIGGSPSGYRFSMDTDRKILYMAGVGGIQSYDYEGEAVLRASSNPILAGSDPSSDYYSHLLYKDDMLYISNYSGNKLNRIQVIGSGKTPEYTRLEDLVIGDGPGAMAFYIR